MKNYVLDSYALLVYFQNEAGSDEVKGLLKQAAAGEAALFLSAVNLGEIAYITRRRAGAENERAVIIALEALPITLVDATKSQALAAAAIKAEHPVSFADCFALALARQVGGEVVTGDPEFEKAQGIAPVRWLPRKTGLEPF